MYSPIEITPSGGEMVVAVDAPKIEVTSPMKSRLKPQVASRVSIIRP